LCNYVDVYKNEYITPDIDFMAATATKSELDKFRLRYGDILITKDSEEWNDIAVPAFVSQDFETVACGYHLSQVRAFTDIIHPEYLFRAFMSGGVAEQFQVAANGVTRFGLSVGAITTVLFPVPPLDEQRTIAVFLADKTRRIDRLVAGLPSDVTGSGILVRFGLLLHEYRAALVTSAVTGQIDVRKYRSEATCQ
jgi:type I restriction enzyme S subunit